MQSFPPGSVTALMSAFARAHHRRHDRPTLFDDAIAERLFSEEELARLEANRAETLALFGASIVLARARWAEDLLAEASRRGVRQCVLLGAGFETLAYRRRELELTVFEVDAPARQAQKRARVERAGLVTSRLHHVAADLRNPDWATVLRSSSFDGSAKTFFSCLGVTYHLEREMVIRALQSVRSLAAPGSLFVFDWLDDAAFDPWLASPRVRRMRDAVARAGEPLETGFAPGELAALLAECGFLVREVLTPLDIQERYFRARDDDHRAVEHLHLTCVEVPTADPPKASMDEANARG